jgi:hypothetical protein
MKNNLDDIESRFDWISAVAIKKFENAERAYDVLNNRAGLVIGWSGLLTATFLPTIQLLPSLGRLTVLSIWSVSFACMIYNGYKAFSVQGRKIMPLSSGSLSMLTSLPSLEARAKLIKQIVLASELNEKTCGQKAIYLDRAIKLFAFQLLLLITTIVIAVIKY